MCPGFGQDRVNFHQESGGNTAGWADPTWPNRAGYSIPCAIMLGSSGGELGSGKAVVAWERTWWRVVRVALCVLLFVLCILLIRIVVVTVPFVCCSVKLPLSQPTIFLPVSFYSPSHPSGGRGGRAAAWPFCCRPQANYSSAWRILHVGNKNFRTSFFCVPFIFLFFSNFQASEEDCSQRRNLWGFSDNCWSPLHVVHPEQ